MWVGQGPAEGVMGTRRAVGGEGYCIHCVVLALHEAEGTCGS